MIVPYTLLANQSQIELLIKCGDRNIKSVYFLRRTVTVFYGIRCGLEKLGPVLLSILCRSRKKIQYCL